jgi:hypothetical protein
MVSRRVTKSNAVVVAIIFTSSPTRDAPSAAARNDDDAQLRLRHVAAGDRARPVYEFVLNHAIGFETGEETGRTTLFPSGSPSTCSLEAMPTM